MIPQLQTEPLVKNIVRIILPFDGFQTIDVVAIHHREIFIEGEIDVPRSNQTKLVLQRYLNRAHTQLVSPNRQSTAIDHAF